jgi:hypothetical protein
VHNIQQFDPLIAPYYMGDYVTNVGDSRPQHFALGHNRDRVRNWLYPNGRHDPNVHWPGARAAQIAATARGR